MKKAVPILAAALLAVSVSACAGGGPAETVESSGTTSGPSSQPQPSEAGSDSPTASGTAQGDPKFGETTTWDGGLKIGVSQPSRYTPSASAKNRVSAKARVFTITVTNGSQRGLIPGGIQIDMTSGGAKVTRVIDEGLWLDSPGTKLEPGKTLTYKMAYELKDPKDIKMTLLPGVEYDRKTFTS